MPPDNNFSIEIAKFCKETPEIADKFVREFNFDLAKAVQSNTPVLSGFLRNSWGVSIGSPDKAEANGTNAFSVGLILSRVKGGAVVYHTNNASYGPFVNFGTSRMAGRHFVERTVAMAEAIAAATMARIKRV